jgi:hypothetical protein
VTSVRLVGSRAEGREHALSDWDLYVQTEDFPRLAADLHDLVGPTGPLLELWDPYGSHESYILMFTGPTKLDICFFDEPREWNPQYVVRPDTLEPIDRHFWDWILWAEQKRRGGHTEEWVKTLDHMHELMLEPMGVAERPRTVLEALRLYLDARDRLEREFGLEVPRTLEREVKPAIEV